MNHLGESQDDQVLPSEDCDRITCFVEAFKMMMVIVMMMMMVLVSQFGGPVLCNMSP